MSEKYTKGEIVRLVLGLIGVAGIVLVGAVAPNIFKMIPRSFLRRPRRININQILERLKDRGLLKLTSGQNGYRLELTERGRGELLAYELQEKFLKKPKHWNGKWHLIVFDINEERKDVRDKVRRSLTRLGFYRLQDSVWVYPYDCEEVLELLRTKYGVRYDALYIRAEKIGQDRWLKKFFQLS